MATKKDTRQTVSVYVDSFVEFKLEDGVTEFLMANAGKEVGATTILKGEKDGKVRWFASVSLINENGLPVSEPRRIWSGSNLLAPLILKIGKGSTDSEIMAVTTAMGDLNGGWRESITGTVIVE